MGETPCFTYWTVECKTPECGLLVLAVIGPCHLGRISYLERCRDFALTCRKCGQTHTYTGVEVKWKDLAVAPPIDFRPDPAFLGATGLEPHQGTVPD
jgi:hypothetical protein